MSPRLTSLYLWAALRRGVRHEIIWCGAAVLKRVQQPATKGLQGLWVLGCRYMAVNPEACEITLPANHLPCCNRARYLPLQGVQDIYHAIRHL